MTKLCDWSRKKWFSTESNVSSRDYLAMPGDLFVNHQQRDVLLASNRWRAAQYPTTRIALPPKHHDHSAALEDSKHTG